MIRAAGLGLGFSQVGFAPARVEDVHRAALAQWLQGGMHAGMAFMAETRAVREAPQRLLPGAVSAIMVALPYAPPMETRGAKMSAYAAGEDYHRILGQKLDALCGRVSQWAPDTGLRPFVDVFPVLERALAAAAGLGFIGRNTMLIHPRDGSFCFLGGIFTTLELEPDAPRAENCGTCTACLAACPTEAFPEAFVLDSRKCIGYLTVEHRGTFTAEESRAVGEWVFGCDACQTVCPWNRQAGERYGGQRDTSVNLIAMLEELASHSFKERYAGRALTRTRRRGLLRNLFAVAVNTQLHDARAAIETFEHDKDEVIAQLARETARRLLATPPAPPSA